ncbi:Uncharacterized protein DAT39_015846, partial [Clarias magur]
MDISEGVKLLTRHKAGLWKSDRVAWNHFQKAKKASRRLRRKMDPYSEKPKHYGTLLSGEA